MIIWQLGLYIITVLVLAAALQSIHDWNLDRYNRKPKKDNK